MAKKSEKNKPLNRILSETRNLIGKECKLKFTTRELSKKADVNLASINYYYNSKGQLVDVVEKDFHKMIQDVYAELENTKRNAKENLTEWAEKLVKLFIDLPGVMYIWPWKVIIGKDADRTLLDMLYSKNNLLTKTLSKALPKAKPEIVNFKSISLVTNLMNPFIYVRGKTAESNQYFNMNNEKSRKQYVELVLNEALS